MYTTTCKARRVGFLAVALGLAIGSHRAAEAATATLTDDNSVVVVETETSAGVFNWTIDGVDHLAQRWYWYRVGDGPEASIDTLILDFQGQSDTNFDGDDETLFVRYKDPGNTFTIEIRYSLNGGVIGFGQSSLDELMTIENTGDAPLAFHIFGYNDYDLAATPLDTSVEIINANTTTQSDGTVAVHTTAVTPAPDRVEVGTGTSLRDSLNDAAATTLSGALGPLGPDDLNWVSEWIVTINPGGSHQISKVTFIDSEIPPCADTIEGCIFCLANGQITDIDGATIKVFQNGNEVGSAAAGSNGVYSIGGLAPGDYTVVVDAPGSTSPCSDTTVPVTITCEENGVASFCLCPFEECVDLSVTKQCLVLAPTGNDCDGKVVEAVFEYTGESCDATSNLQEGKVQCSGDPNDADPVSIEVTKDADKVTVSPASGISIGDLVTFTATGNELRADLKFDILHAAVVEQSLKLHTSCSKPLNVGDQFGSMRLVELTSTRGGTVGLPEPQQPGDACEVVSGLAACGTGDDAAKPDNLTWVYSGGGCGASSNGQPADKAKCSGTIDSAAPVAVMPDRETPFMVSPGEQFTVSRGHSKKMYLTNAGGTEFNEIHTSCSQPLVVGDVYGSLTLVAMDGLGMGQAVVFVYTLTNTGAENITGVTAVDDKLGALPLESDVIPAGESVTVTKTTFVSETSTNTVTVSGLKGNAICDAEDSLTVTVLPPPPPPPASFGCNKPIDVLTMIWDGTQGIRIIAYKGSVGSETLADIDNITPGDEVEVTGFAGSPNDVIWEIFVAGTSDKIGESKFHLSCSDPEMNGQEDCGKREGDGKGNESSLINDWLLEGIVDNTATLNCTP